MVVEEVSQWHCVPVRHTGLSLPVEVVGEWRRPHVVPPQHTPDSETQISTQIERLR